MMNLSTHNGEYSNPTSSWATYFYFTIKMHWTETDSDHLGRPRSYGTTTIALHALKGVQFF